MHADSVKLVMAGSGCEDAKKVEQILQEVGGDVDAANEFLIAEQATADYSAESDKFCCPADTSHGIFENGNYEQQTEELEDNSCMSEQSCDKETTHDSESSHKDEKKITRNKACPCGSKKKYKACCGSVSGRSSKFTVIQTADYSKSQKERKQVTKCANRRRFSKLLIKLLLGLPDLFYHSGMHDYVLQVLDNEGEREVRGCKQEVGICTHKIGMEAPFLYSCTLAFRTV